MVPPRWWRAGDGADMSRLLGRAGQHIGSHTYVRLRKLTRAGQASPLPGISGWDGRRPAAASPKATAAGRAAGAGYGRLTGPLALITWWKATGGLFCTHLPPDFAPMARMLSWYLPLPVIPV